MLRPLTILVGGATGCVGSQLVAYLSAHYPQVQGRALTRTPASDTARHCAALPTVTVVRSNDEEVPSWEGRGGLGRLASVPLQALPHCAAATLSGFRVLFALLCGEEHGAILEAENGGHLCVTRSRTFCFLFACPGATPVQ